MQLTPLTAVLSAIILCAAGAVVVPALSWNKRLAGWFTFLVTASAGAVALWGCYWTIASGPSTPLYFPRIALWGSVLGFSIDGVGAFFVGLISVIGPLAALYSISYMDHYPDYGVIRYYPWFLLFIAGMYAIVTITDTMVFFFAFWQLMMIPSFFLIRFEYRQPKNVRAANKYLAIMELTCFLVMAGSAILAYADNAPHTGTALSWFNFYALRERIAAGGISPPAFIVAFTCLLGGFGIKAGVWPLGLIWLPDAHPAAPSPVSALLSGVMIKTGVYGLIRTCFWLMPNASVPGFSPRVWGSILAVVGTVTLVVGTFQALRQEETKRLLAFHSIGQIGYIVLGLGACLVLLPEGPGPAAIATLALVGALFHTLNHALFKSLLFFNAGTILKATGTQDLNKLGGLIKYMPVTAITCMIASFSIAGVPLFNGFASKWSIYSATVLGGKTVGILVACGLFGVLTSGLTLASFMKFFGTSFLSRASATVKESARQKTKLEAGFLMQLPQILLACACVFLGIVPAAGYALFAACLASGPEGISSHLPALDMSSVGPLSGVAIIDGSGLFVPVLIVLVLAVLMLVAWLFSRLGGSKKREAPVWLCGYDRESDRNRYNAHNLYGEVKKLFGGGNHAGGTR
jgi:formate hydrogenlyase subunit 3/multisubunit Na+/H+ antiporter MnhD subunit